MANPFNRLLRVLGNLLGFAREKQTPPVQEPVEQPPIEQPEELPPPKPMGGYIIEETPTVLREDENVFYVSSTSKTLGRWQAGTLANPVEMQDVQAMMDMVPLNVEFYVFIIHGSTVALYNLLKEQNDTYLSLKIPADVAQRTILDPTVEFPTDYVNLMESFMEGPQWEYIYELSVVDRF